MNRTTSVIVALIAAATLTTIGISVPQQQALACGGGGCGYGGGFYNGPIIPYWSYGFLGNGGVLISPPILAGFFGDGCGGGCGGGFGGGFGGGGFDR
ncbi:MAG: hypothetical protein WAM14_10305 [Candidatus Nitrosopolaris sp.]